MILPYLDQDLLFFMGKNEIGNIVLLSRYHQALVEKNWLALTIGMLESQNYIVYEYRETISLIYKNCKTNCTSLPKNRNIIIRKISV